jgi:acetyl esterase/lipase
MLFRQMMSHVPSPTRVQTREVDADGVSCEWVWPARLHHSRAARAVLFVHGGGLFAGSSDTHRLIAGSFAKSTSSDVLVVNYRLLPEESYPAPLDDVLSAYRWLLYSGYKSGNIAVVGDSYGATLAIAAINQQIESGGATPSSVVAMSPVLALPEAVAAADAKDPLWRMTRVGDLARDQRSLITAAGAPKTAFPPMLVQAAEEEAPFAGTSDFVSRRKHDGADISMTRWPHVMHEWQLFPDRLDEARRSNQEAAEFVMAHFQDRPKPD